MKEMRKGCWRKEMKSKEESDERKINKKGKEEKYRIKKIKNK